LAQKVVGALLAALIAHHNLHHFGHRGLQEGVGAVLDELVHLLVADLDAFGQQVLLGQVHADGLADLLHGQATGLQILHVARVEACRFFT